MRIWLVLLCFLQCFSLVGATEGWCLTAPAPESNSSQATLITTNSQASLANNNNSITIEQLKEEIKDLKHQLELQSQKSTHNLELQTQKVENLASNTVKEAESSAITALQAAEMAHKDNAHTMSVLGTFATIFIVLAGFGTWQSHVTSKANDSATEANKRAEEVIVNYEKITSQYQKDQEALQELKKTISSSDNVTDQKIEEIQALAANTAPFAQATLASRNSKWELANSLWQQVCLALPKNDKAQFQFARSFINLAQQETELSKKIKLLNLSQKHHNEALKRNPNNRAALKNLGKTLLDFAELEKDLGEKEKLRGEAKIQLHKAINLAEPATADDYIALGNCYFELAKLAEEDEKSKLLELAKAAYEKALELDPNNINAHNNLGVYYFELAELEEEDQKKLKLLELAKVAYESALVLDPNDSATQHNLGICYYELAKLEKEDQKKLELLELAKQSYKKALKLDPNNSSAHNNLGSCYFGLAKLEEEDKKKLELFEQAIQACEKAIELDPNDSDILNNLNMCKTEIAKLTKQQSKTQNKK